MTIQDILFGLFMLFVIGLGAHAIHWKFKYSNGRVRH